MAQTIIVRHVSGEHFAVDIRGHQLAVDQPKTAPNLEAGPTPVELFVAALASCAAHSAQLVLAKVDADASVTATCGYEMSGPPPWRVESVHIAVVLPNTLSAERLASVRRAVDQCTVHQSLRQPAEVEVTLVTGSPAVLAMAAVNADAAILERTRRPSASVGSHLDDASPELSTTARRRAPVRQERAHDGLEREKGLEPSTSSLEGTVSAGMLTQNDFRARVAENTKIAWCRKRLENLTASDGDLSAGHPPPTSDRAARGALSQAQAIR
jgi:putative redox protein